ncbi:MAG: endonuclease domain-containing protein [Chitinophagaceae bacterium]|nr:MAG: endonuclease domain-containing protein [Chitinophagaceae bacterium]
MMGKTPCNGKKSRKSGVISFADAEGVELLCKMKTPSGQFGYHHTSARKFRNRLGFARENRKNPTVAEKILWEELRSKRLGGFKFRRQHIIGVHIVDFVCLTRNLIVEVDGEIHNTGENPELDRSRTKDLEAAGFEVIRFTNDEVLTDIERVCYKILRRLNGRPV